MPIKKPKKTTKAKPCVTAVTTSFHNDVIDARHYIVNGYPECVSFWNLTNKLNLITEDQLVRLIRLNVDIIMAVKCNGCCTIQVTTNGYSHNGRSTKTSSVKAPSCDGKCTIHIKRIL